MWYCGFANYITVYQARGVHFSSLSLPATEQQRWFCRFAETVFLNHQHHMMNKGRTFVLHPAPHECQDGA